jgi:hypothetical protein
VNLGLEELNNNLVLNVTVGAAALFNLLSKRAALVDFLVNHITD